MKTALHGDSGSNIHQLPLWQHCMEHDLELHCPQEFQFMLCYAWNSDFRMEHDLEFKHPPRIPMHAEGLTTVVKCKTACSYLHCIQVKVCMVQTLEFNTLNSHACHWSASEYVGNSNWKSCPVRHLGQALLPCSMHGARLGIHLPLRNVDPSPEAGVGHGFGLHLFSPRANCHVTCMGRWMEFCHSPLSRRRW